MTLDEALAIAEECRYTSGRKSDAPAVVVLAAEIHRLRGEAKSYVRRLDNQRQAIRSLQKELDK